MQEKIVQKGKFLGENRPGEMPRLVFLDRKCPGGSCQGGYCPCGGNFRVELSGRNCSEGNLPRPQFNYCI